MSAEHKFWIYLGNNTDRANFSHKVKIHFVLIAVGGRVFFALVFTNSCRFLPQMQISRFFFCGTIIVSFRCVSPGWHKKKKTGRKKPTS